MFYQIKYTLVPISSHVAPGEQISLISNVSKLQISGCSAWEVFLRWFHTDDTAFVTPTICSKFQHNQPHHGTQCVFCGSLVNRGQINPTFLIKLQRLAGFMAAFQANYFHPVVGETFTCLWMWWEGKWSWGLFGVRVQWVYVITVGW